MKKSYYNNQNSFYAAETFKYDEKGNLLEQQMLEDGWLARSTTVYKSDAKGNYLDATINFCKSSGDIQYLTQLFVFELSVSTMPFFEG